MNTLKYTLSLILLLGLSALAAEKMLLRKDINPRAPKAHPHINLLNKQDRAAEQNTKDGDYQRLLVILVDFQEESTDDPLTTGNGKFQLEPDPTYLYSIGSPPHDRDYYLANLEAMRYYYLAVSGGSYDLQYDVYPSGGGAYTLPHSMGYYNPPEATSADFVAKMEEYFLQSFQTADAQDPQIDFSAYAHYMIIHAGSDWQHDVNGDTVSDIPSFFIRVSPGKEAVVDEGATLISHACNVPATIAQDFSVSESSGVNVLSGYGALNSVLVHEFGHSLGLVDLYNVQSFQPMVGMFDIMDSGGSGVLVDQLQDGSLVMVEGILPALPGAFSRMLLFADHYEANGYLMDADLQSMNSGLELAASSLKQSGTAKPHTLRIPLSDKEYLLVENRSVDPDNDGGTAVFGTLDGRVILYPTPINDPANNPSYEYDYLLPSFQTSSGEAVGGGLLVWHVNEDVIYDQGITLSDGSWVSNFENNTVNTQYFGRGVKVIEADGLQDIGYNWSWYWTGTQYEYFHKNRPVLDSNGSFVNWSQSLWKPELSSVTIPAILDRFGSGSRYSITDIGNPGALMNFALQDNFFTSRQTQDTGSAHTIIGPVINTSFADAAIPLIDSASITLLSWDGSSWTDQMGAFAYAGSPGRMTVVAADQNFDAYTELVLTDHHRIHIIDFANDALNQTTINMPATLACAPMYYSGALYAAAGHEILKISSNSIETRHAIPGAKDIAIHAGQILVLSSDKLSILSPDDLSLLSQMPLPETFGDYQPISFSGGDELISYLMANSGNIYSFRADALTRIFTNSFSSLPTQMGITAFGGESPALFFGVGNRVQALSMDGSNLAGYPVNASPLSFTPKADVFALSLDQDLIYLPHSGKGHAAFAFGSGPLWNLSLLSQPNITNSRLHWNNAAQRVEWQHANSAGLASISSLPLAEDPISWNGYRNNGTGLWAGYIIHAPAQSSTFDAYVYPSPVRGNEFRLRVLNSSEDINVEIYDINGSMIQRSVYAYDQQSSRDIRFQAQLASGVYILSVNSGSHRKTLKFAVEK